MGVTPMELDDDDDADIIQHVSIWPQRLRGSCAGLDAVAEGPQGKL